MKKRKQYTEEFKREAVRVLVTRGAQTVAGIAESLGAQSSQFGDIYTQTTLGPQPLTARPICGGKSIIRNYLNMLNEQTADLCVEALDYVGLKYR